MKYKSYDNKIFMDYSQINNKAKKFTELEYHKKKVTFSEGV